MTLSVCETPKEFIKQTNKQKNIEQINGSSNMDRAHDQSTKMHLFLCHTNEDCKNKIKKTHSQNNLKMNLTK
jgi:hypothetical protein